MKLLAAKGVQRGPVQTSSGGWIQEMEHADGVGYAAAVTRAAAVDGRSTG